MEFKTIHAKLDTGSPIVAASAYVYSPGTTSQVSVFDEDGGALSQPLSTDRNGNVSFATRNGAVDVAITFGGQTKTIENERFFAAEDIAWDGRAALVTAVAAGYTWAAGTVISDGTVFYKAVSASTVISDLPGLVPFCPVGWCSAMPEHFKDNNVPGTTNMTAGIQAAIDYCETFGGGTFGQGAAVGFLARDYQVSDTDASGFCLTMSEAISFKGQGANSTSINVNQETGVVLYIGKGDTAIMADTAGTARVLGALVQDLQIYNLGTDTPTSCVGIRMDRSAAHVDRCYILNFYRGVELLGAPESAKVTNCDITQGGNNKQSLSYDARSGAFAVDEDVTGGTSGATATVVSVTVDADTSTGTLVLTGVIGTFQDNEAITGDGTGAATVNGTITKSQALSAGIAIMRRQVNAALGSAYLDSGDSLYYVECNSVFLTGNNVRMGAFDWAMGADYSLLIGACDGLYASDNHFAWGSVACVGLTPEQSNIGFTNVNLTGGLVDPLPGKSQYGVRVHDRYSVSTSSLGSVVLSGVQIAGCVLDGVSLSMQCRRFQMSGGEIKNCGRYGLSINSLSVTDTLIDGVHIFDTDDDGTGTDAAVYLATGQRTTISNCNINNTGRGIYVGADALRTSISGNTFEAISSGNSIYLQNNGIDKADLAACANNDIEESATVASADRIRIPVGADHIYITGTTDIWEIREDSPSSTYSDRVVHLTFAGALDLKDDGGGSPPGGSSPNLRIGADFTAAAGTHATLKWQADLDKWILTATRANA